LSMVLAALFLIEFITVIIFGDFSVKVFVSVRAFVSAFLAFLLLAIILYFAEREDLVLRNLPNGHFTPWDLLYVGSSFLFAAMAVVLTGGAQSGLKFTLGAPVLVAAVLRGRVAALVTGALVAIAVIFLDLLSLVHDLLTSDALLVFFMLSLGWAIGGITDAEMAYTAQLAEMADRDSLTGLYNHRAFQERMHDCFKTAVARREPLTLVMADIDDFKLYNESYGHQKGDEVLAGVGEIFARTVGTRGMAARYGGEEFVVVLPGQTVEGGRRLAEEKVKKYRLRHVSYGLLIHLMP